MYQALAGPVPGPCGCTNPHRTCSTRVRMLAIDVFTHCDKARANVSIVGITASRYLNAVHLYSNRPANALSYRAPDIRTAGAMVVLCTAFAASLSIRDRTDSFDRCAVPWHDVLRTAHNYTAL